MPDDEDNVLYGSDLTDNAEEQLLAERLEELRKDLRLWGRLLKLAGEVLEQDLALPPLISVRDSDARFTWTEIQDLHHWASLRAQISSVAALRRHPNLQKLAKCDTRNAGCCLLLRCAIHFLQKLRMRTL